MATDKPAKRTGAAPKDSPAQAESVPEDTADATAAAPGDPIREREQREQLRRTLTQKFRHQWRNQ